MDFGICVCGHEIEDHVSEGAHCTVPGCLCTWFQADDTPPPPLSELETDNAV